MSVGWRLEKESHDLSIDSLSGSGEVSLCIFFIQTRKCAPGSHAFYMFSLVLHV